RTNGPPQGAPMYKTFCCLTALATLCLWAAPNSALAQEPRRITPDNVAGIRELKQIDKDVQRIVWNPDRSQVAFVYWEKPVEILATEGFRKLRTIGDGKKVIGFAFSPRKDTVAFSENGFSVEMLNLRTGESIKLEAGAHQPGVEFSPDGTLLATTGYGTEV